MKIQFNTDKTIDWDDRHSDHFSAEINEGLRRFSDKITRIEAHISDENGTKEGPNDIRCLLEVRIEGRQPIAVSSQADSIQQSMAGALSKMKASLASKLDK